MILSNRAYDFSHTDRLGLALFVSILAHMVIVLGVSFGAPRIRAPGAETLEITLVQTRTDKAPHNAQFLAQANQDGGGNARTRDVARSPLPMMEMSDQNRRAPAAAPPPQKRVDNVTEFIAFLTRLNAERAARSAKPRPDRKQEQQQPERTGLPEPRTRPERARLNAEIDRSFQENQAAPRHLYLNARTQEYKYATYMDAWRAKVERIGNLNYPEQARRQGLAGSLVLDVAINPDGSLNGTQVLRSSGHKLLDDAAVRIVEMAAPYPALPPDIRAETDVLHITRTWKFRENYVVNEAN
jgi:protein TonB